MRENNYENTPMLRTVEHSTMGDGLRHTAIDQEEEVVFDQQQMHGAPLTAGNNSYAGQYHEFSAEDDERMGRNRQRKAYATNEHSHTRSKSFESGRNGDQNGRFDSLILAKRIKNEN